MKEKKGMQRTFVHFRSLNGFFYHLYLGERIMISFWSMVGNFWEPADLDKRFCHWSETVQQIIGKPTTLY